MRFSGGTGPPVVKIYNDSEDGILDGLYPDGPNGQGPLGLDGPADKDKIPDNVKPCPANEKMTEDGLDGNHSGYKKSPSLVKCIVMEMQNFFVGGNQ